MVPVAIWTTRRDTQKLETCSAHIRSAIYTSAQGIAQWTTVKFWVSFESGRHLPTNGVIRTPSETTALGRTLPWLDDEQPTNCVRWASKYGNSKVLSNGLKKEPALWSCMSG